MTTTSTRPRPPAEDPASAGTVYVNVVPGIDRGPITAHVAAGLAAEALATARGQADEVRDAGARVAALAGVAAGWRDLALALATHQGLAPPREVDVEAEAGRRRR